MDYKVVRSTPLGRRCAPLRLAALGRPVLTAALGGFGEGHSSLKTSRRFVVDSGGKTMTWVDGLDPGLSTATNGAEAFRSAPGSGRPRDRDGRAGAGRDRGGRRDGRAPGLRPAELRASRSRKGYGRRSRASPRQPARDPQFGFAGVPFPGAWMDSILRKRASEAGRSAGDRPGPTPAALATRPRPPTQTPSGRPKPKRGRHAPPPAQRALAEFRIYDYSICHAHRMRDQRPTYRPNRLKESARAFEKKPTLRVGFFVGPGGIPPGPRPIRKG